MRPTKNNEELSVPKYILSSYYPPSVPFKCHLWSVRLFAAKRETFPLFFSKVMESISNLCVELWQVAPNFEALKTFILKSPNERCSSKQLGEHFQSLLKVSDALSLK